MSYPTTYDLHIAALLDAAGGISYDAKEPFTTAQKENFLRELQIARADAFGLSDVTYTPVPVLPGSLAAQYHQGQLAQGTLAQQAQADPQGTLSWILILITIIGLVRSGL